MGAAPSRRSGSSTTGPGAEVMAHERAYDAHQLRLAGLSWHEIADRVGYLDGRIAAAAVNAYLQKIALEQAPDQRRRALDLELAASTRSRPRISAPRSPATSPRPTSCLR